MYSCVAFLCSLVIFACNQKHTHEFREYNFDRCCSRSGRRRRTQWMANGKQLNYNIRGMFISMSDHTVSVLKRNRHSPSFLLLKFTVPWHKIRRWTWYVRTDLFAHSICWVRFFFLFLYFFCAHRARLKQTRAIQIDTGGECRIDFRLKLLIVQIDCVYACKLNWRNQSFVVIVGAKRFVNK